MMEKLKIMGLLGAILCFSFPISIYGEGRAPIIRGLEETEILDSLLEEIDTEKLDEMLDTKGAPLSFRELVEKAIQGDMDFSLGTIVSYISASFLSDIRGFLKIISQMLMVAILSAFFKTLSTNFNQKSVIEIGFYASFIGVLALLFTSFRGLLGILEKLLGEISIFVEIIIPVVLSIMGLSGRYTTAFTYGPFLFMGLDFILIFLRYAFIPTVGVVASFYMVNYISEKEILTKFAELMKSILTWVLKITAMVFMGILTLQGLTGPSLDGMVNKTAKMAVSVVPVVGPVMTTAVDTVMAMTKTMKSGVMIGLVVVTIIYVLGPLIKMASIVFVYKLTAALIQPICEERLVNAVDGAGKFGVLVLGAGLMVAMLIIFMVVLFLSI